MLIEALLWDCLVRGKVCYLRIFIYIAFPGMFEGVCMLDCTWIHGKPSASRRKMESGSDERSGERMGSDGSQPPGPCPCLDIIIAAGTLVQGV